MRCGPVETEAMGCGAVERRFKAVPVCDGRPVAAVDRSEAAKAAVERPFRDTKRAAAT